MPTAAKLVALVLFAVLGFALAEVFKTAMTAATDRTEFGTLSPICAAIGGLCGWVVMGGLAGRGASAAWGYGVRTAVTTVAWAALGFSIYEMVIRSTRGRYGGSPIEALSGAVELLLGYGRLMLDPAFIGTVIIGGAVAGLAVEWSSRRWT